MIIMTAGEMLRFMDRLNEVIEAKLTEAFKNGRLANLMTDLERAYQIPGLLANATNVDPVALQSYQMVSAERGF